MAILSVRYRVLPRRLLNHLLILVLAVASFSGNAFAGQLTLAWDSVSGATGYLVYFGTASAQYSSTQEAGNNTTTTVSGLTDGVRYYFAVKAHNATTTSGYSNEVNAVVPGAAAPVASFTASQTTGTAPLSVTFTDTSTGAVTSRTWNLGDGSTATSPTVTKTYSTAGTFTVVLAVTGAGGTTTAMKTINVSAPAPVAGFTASQTTGTAPLTVTFSDTSTGTVTGRSWNLGDGTSAASATSVVKTYSAAGTYNVVLTVTGPGGTATATQAIIVKVATSSVPPVAIFAADTVTGPAPLLVNFSDSSTGAVSSWSWNFGDGGMSTSRNPTHTYTQAGVYTVTLVVSGSAGSDTLSRTGYVQVDGADVPMEVGEVQINDKWKRVNFNTQFSDPIVVVNPLSANDPTPAVVRVDGVDPGGFSVRVQEWEYLDGKHGDETVSYMVMENGSHQLPNGTWAEAGRLTTKPNSNTFVSGTLTAPFGEVPVVVTSVTSVNEAHAVATQLRSISRTGFQVRIKEQQASTHRHPPETIDYIAWEPSFGVVSGLRYEAGLISGGVSSQVQTLIYQSAFSQPPLFLANMQTTNGADPADLRQANRNEVSVETWVLEEQSKDTETSHATESVGYFALEPDVTEAPQPGVCATPCSLWSGAITPTLLADPDNSPVELGVKFRSDVDGFITGIRYYKSPQNTGVHVGSLWSNTGQLLANATFSSETTSGWQSVKFPTPVAIKANTVYVASYHTNAGRYSVDEGYFASGYGNGPLRALANGENGGNGLYVYGGGGFPTNTYKSDNYWVDVIFTTQ